MMLWALLLQPYLSVLDNSVHRSTYRIRGLLVLLMVVDFHHVVHNNVIQMDQLIHVTLVPVVNSHSLDFHSIEEVADNHLYDMIRNHHDHDLYRRLVRPCLCQLLQLFQLDC